jgi:formylglycine-generating enzyme required for sulfatase activity
MLIRSMIAVMAIVTLLGAAGSSLLYAASTRGLKVIAKDVSTGLQQEISLYNKTYAVIIGIDSYQNLPPDRQLSYAVRDAKGVEQVLRKQYRFDRIVTLYNEQATKDRILELLTENLPSEMGEEDAVFIFWAGHGNQEKGAQGKELGYLIPYDGSSDKIRKNITMTEIRDTISTKLPAKHVFYVMDACYSGLLTATRSVDNKPRRDLNYLKEITREPVRQVLTAGGKGQEVLDGGPNGHSVFTGRLIAVLEAAGDFITANEIQTILREKVYNDAKGRGHNQMPSFGSLSGNGDFVFVPSIDQKLEESRAEIEKLEKEKAEMERLETEAQKAHNEKQRREAERKKLAADAKLVAEELKKQQLQEEQSRAELTRLEQGRFLAEQQKQQDELVRRKQEDDSRLARLKTEIENKKKKVSAASASSLEEAVVEIKRLSAEVDGIAAAIASERKTATERIESRYAELIAEVRRQKELTTNQSLQRDEFDTEAEFKERQSRRLSGFDERISSLENLKSRELEDLGRKLAQEQIIQTDTMRKELRSLAEKKFRVDPSMLGFSVAKYDVEKQRFPLEITSKTGSAVKIAMHGTIPLPKAQAKEFRRHLDNGLVRPEITVKGGSLEILEIVLIDDAAVSEADNYLMVLENSEFISVAEKKKREAEHQRKVAEEAAKRKAVELAPFDLELVSLPAGCFNTNGTEVCLDSFSIGKYEITQGQWKRMMGRNPSHFKECGESCPVENVSWNDVQEFIRKLNGSTGRNYRLPTESEWEYACRSGGKSEAYCGEGDVDELAWFDNNSDDKTHRIGQRKSNGLGIFDMSGNVWEWCQDWYGYSFPSGGRKNPTGPSSGSQRVSRGGGWIDDAGFVRSNIRSNRDPGRKYDSQGFRLAITAPP